MCPANMALVGISLRSEQSNILLFSKRSAAGSELHGVCRGCCAKRLTTALSGWAAQSYVLILSSRFLRAISESRGQNSHSIPCGGFSRYRVCAGWRFSIAGGCGREKANLNATEASSATDQRLLTALCVCDTRCTRSSTNAAADAKLVRESQNNKNIWLRISNTKRLGARLRLSIAGFLET